MPVKGLEPPLPCGKRILSPSRLPFRHTGTAYTYSGPIGARQQLSGDTQNYRCLPNIESSVFPIPPDALLIPMMVAQPHRAFRLAALCTVMSVLGGFLGYAIGYYAFDAFGEPILRFYGAMARYEELKQSFAEYGAWIIILKGMTPIPYKLITIASGVFMIVASMGRSGTTFYDRELSVSVGVDKFDRIFKAVTDR